MPLSLCVCVCVCVYTFQLILVYSDYYCIHFKVNLLHKFVQINGKLLQKLNVQSHTFS